MLECAPNTEALDRVPQVAAAVRALLPDVEYSAQARVLTLRGAQGGRRKQRRLPGAPRSARAMLWLGVAALLLRVRAIPWVEPVDGLSVVLS